jgi:L-seryl-tRNA(Ser) seleniumtransferase
MSQHSIPPSVNSLLILEPMKVLIETHGRKLTTEVIREVLANIREEIAQSREKQFCIDEARIITLVSARLAKIEAPTFKPVFNLTGTVLHTNLGRAVLATEAINAINDVARGASNLEYDLHTGRRGDRDSHIEDIICSLTGAEAATLVNNNAAAVMLVLNTLALRKEVPVSRGELIEIGGSFRIPDIMSRSGCRLVEVGTTNRTHIADYEAAINSRTAIFMSIHTSNYKIEGFTNVVSETELASLAHKHNLPFVVDLGSGTLVDLEYYGLPHEPTPNESIVSGADLITFSGDKLLGGPQSGIIVGNGDLIAKLKKNPLKRAMRCDKFTIAALAATLRLYKNPDKLAERLPTLRILTRSVEELKALSERLIPPLKKILGENYEISGAKTFGQIGSGSLPIENLHSFAVKLTPHKKRGKGKALKEITTKLRALPAPIIGRVHNDSLWLDLRCLENENEFLKQISMLTIK